LDALLWRIAANKVVDEAFVRPGRGEGAFREEHFVEMAQTLVVLFFGA